MNKPQKIEGGKVIKVIKKAIRNSLACRDCGRTSPNPCGECRCSYDLEMFTDINWKLLLERL